MVKIGAVTRGTQASREANIENTLPNSSEGIIFEIKDLMMIEGPYETRPMPVLR